jgi:gliding motility-associated-like protein
MYLDTFIVNINDKVEFTEFEENPVYIDENTGPEILISSLTPIAILTTDIHTYTLSADTTNFPDNNMFWIQTDSLINKYNFDYEIQEEYILLIEVRDRFDTMYLDTFIVNINDIDEFEYFEEDPIYFDENQIVGTMVSVLVPVGSLFGEELTYSLSTDTIYFSDNSAFSIVEDELLSAEVYNYETQNEYNLLVEIRNEFGTLYLDTVLVIINDLIEFDDLKVTNFVTPNEDGKNDYFAIPNPELFSDYTLRIFNDNGNEVYLQEGDYNNDWNGLTTSGEELPSATYYYTFIQKGQELNNFVGKVTILRTSKF